MSSHPAWPQAAGAPGEPETWPAQRTPVPAMVDNGKSSSFGKVAGVIAFVLAVGALLVILWQ